MRSMQQTRSRERSRFTTARSIRCSACGPIEKDGVSNAFIAKWGAPRVTSFVAFAIALTATVVESADDFAASPTLVAKDLAVPATAPAVVSTALAVAFAALTHA